MLVSRVVRPRSRGRAVGARRDRAGSSTRRWARRSKPPATTAIFAELAPDPRPPGSAAPARPSAVSLLGRVLVLRGGVQLDLNGVVKAIAVDDALALLRGPGFVSAGGDLAAKGEVDVALSHGGAVRLHAGGLATSGRTRRRWLRGGEEQHHLIDPRTGLPSRVPLGRGHGLRLELSCRRRVRESRLPSRRRRACLARRAGPAWALRRRFRARA